MAKKETAVTVNPFITALSSTDQAFATITEATRAIVEGGYEFDGEKRVNVTERVTKFVDSKYGELGTNREVAEKVILLNTVTIPSAMAEALHEQAFKHHVENKAEFGQYESSADCGVTQFKATVNYNGQDFSKSTGVTIKHDAIVAHNEELHTKMRTMMQELLGSKK